MSALFLSACSGRELEDKSFPLAIGIDRNQEGMALSFDFPLLEDSEENKNPSGKSVNFSVEAGAYYEAQKAYENNTNKVLDYNHLKAILIGEKFLADPEELRNLLAWLEQEEVIARNTYLFVAKEQASEILTLTEETGGSVGEYLEQMLKTQEDFKENKIMTIGDLMNQWHNQNELLLLPVLTNNGEVPSVTEYAVLDAFSYQGNITVEEAMKAFLCQGLLERFTCRLEGGEVVEIQNIGVKCGIDGSGDRVTVRMDLSGQAKVKQAGLEKNVTSAQLKKQLDQQLEESMEVTAVVLEREPGIDITNSFVKLGGYARGLYEQYQGDYAGYQEHLGYDFSVDMKIVEE